MTFYAFYALYGLKMFFCSLYFLCGYVVYLFSLTKKDRHDRSFLFNNT